MASDYEFIFFINKELWKQNQKRFWSQIHRTKISAAKAQNILVAVSGQRY